MNPIEEKGRRLVIGVDTILPIELPNAPIWRGYSSKLKTTITPQLKQTANLNRKAITPFNSSDSTLLTNKNKKTEIPKETTYMKDAKCLRFLPPERKGIEAK